MKSFQVDCVDKRVYRTLVELAKECGWPGSSLNVKSNFRWLSVGDRGIDGDHEKITADTISIEAAINLLKEGPPKPNVTLELTSEEANTLREVVAHIGGCPDKSRRRYTEAIGRKLDDKGICRLFRKPCKDIEEGRNLHFLDSE